MAQKYLSLAFFVFAFACSDNNGAQRDASPREDLATDGGVDADPSDDGKVLPDEGVPGPWDGETCDLGLTNQTGSYVVTCDDLEVTITVPTQCETMSCGLLADWHGARGRLDLYEGSMKTRPRADEVDMIVIQPQDNTKGYFIEEVDALMKVLREVGAFWNVDENRVHAKGNSMGGKFVWDVFCRFSNIFASVVVFISHPTHLDDVKCSMTGDEVPEFQRDIMMIHGDKDAIFFLPQTKAIRDNIIETWNMDTTTEVSESDTHLWTRYTNDQGTTMEFIEFDGAHCSPAFETDQDGKYPDLCPTVYEIDTPQIAIDFLDAHPK